jgi:heme exporter protein D
VLVRRNWWWIVLTGIGVSVIVVVVIIVSVKLVRKKRLRDMERESEKSETIGNVWIGRSRMPAATMVRTQPCLEYHEDLPSSSNIP